MRSCQISCKIFLDRLYYNQKITIFQDGKIDKKDHPVLCNFLYYIIYNEILWLLICKSVFKNIKTSSKTVEVNDYNELLTSINNAVSDSENDEYIINLNEGIYLQISQRLCKVLWG